MSDRFSLKDHLFNKESVTYFADLFYQHDSKFPRTKFIKNILNDFPELELKQRITRICDELAIVLPDDYPTALKIVLQALPPELDPTKTDDDFGEFILAPIAEYIQRYGCTEKYCDRSLLVLRECTKRFTVEGAIRYFINNFPEKTMQFLNDGAVHENYHVRRLSSEGTRPKLPWCIGITTNYRDALPILDKLYVDTTRYVTRSVANHLNDIAKFDPELVIETLRRWRDSGKQNDKEMNYIMNHALRTLVKQGNVDALELLGYPSRPKITIENFQVHTPQINIGESLEFSCNVVSRKQQNLMIDYVVHHPTARGTTNPKVFKIKKGSFDKDDLIQINKKQPFKIMTTKKLYPGTYHCELQINGKNVYDFSFELVQ